MPFIVSLIVFFFCCRMSNRGQSSNPILKKKRPVSKHVRMGHGLDIEPKGLIPGPEVLFAALKKWKFIAERQFVPSHNQMQ